MAEERAELAATLAGLETRLIRRLTVAFERSPESHLEEAGTGLGDQAEERAQ